MNYPITGIVLFVAEIVYLLLFFEPHPAHTQASLMLIFAAEMSLFLPLAKSNVEEKKTLGSVSPVSRTFTSIFGLGVLGMIALATDLAPLERPQYVWAACFLITLVGKLGWKRYKPLLSK